MPSLWPRFDRDDALILGEDLPDLIAFGVPSVEAVLLAGGHKGVYDMIGYTSQEWAFLMEATPPNFQEPWTPEKLPWFPAKEGFAMCKTLRAAMIQSPDVFSDYPTMVDDILEHVVEFETVLQRAWNAGANFNLVVDT